MAPYTPEPPPQAGELPITGWAMKVLRDLNNADSRTHQTAFWGMLILVVALRAAAFQGYSAGDPRAYSVLAYDCSRGTLHIPSWGGAPIFPLRIGVYGPTAAVLRVFGLSEIALVAYPFVVSSFGCLLIYFFIRRVFAPLAALIGLSLLAALPNDVSMASLFYPDAIAAFWANLAIFVAWPGAHNAGIRRAALLGVLSGLLFGISWLCKESVVYLLPAVIIVLLFAHRDSSLVTRLVGAGAVGIGAFLMLLAESAFHTILTGDPLFRIHETERNYVYAYKYFFDSSSPLFGWESGGYAKALAKRLFFQGPQEILLNRPMLFLPLTGVIAAAWMTVFRVRRAYVVIAWLTSLILMFNFMSSSFTAYKPLVLFPRYLYPVLFPAIMLTSGLLATLLLDRSGNHALRKERVFWGTTLLVVLLGLCAINLPSKLRARPEDMERYISSRLKNGDVIVTDARTASTFEFLRNSSFAPSSETTINWDTVKEQDIPQGAYVLVNRARLRTVATIHQYSPPPFVLKPPDNWQKIWADQNADLYLVK
jgi:Dolichyl-phosphate-mannose-protein mannosyltransferase